MGSYDPTTNSNLSNMPSLSLQNSVPMGSIHKKDGKQYKNILNITEYMAQKNFTTSRGDRHIPKLTLTWLYNWLHTPSSSLGKVWLLFRSISEDASPSTPQYIEQWFSDRKHVNCKDSSHLSIHSFTEDTSCYRVHAFLPNILKSSS